MTKAEVLNRLLFAKNLYKEAFKVVDEISEEVYKATVKDVDDDDDETWVLVNFVDDAIKKLSGSTEANAVYNEIMGNDDIKAIFSDDDIEAFLPYPRLSVDKNDPSYISMYVPLMGKGNKVGQDKLVLSTDRCDLNTIQASLIYKSKHACEHDLAFAEVKRGDVAVSDGKNSDNEDVDVYYYEDIFDECYSKKVTITRDEIAEAEEEPINEGDFVWYTDKKGKKHLTVVIDFSSDGNARIITTTGRVKFELTNTDSLGKAEGLTDEMKGELLTIYKLGLKTITSNGRGKIITAPDDDWMKRHIDTYKACNRLHKLVSGTDDDLAMSTLDVSCLIRPIDRYMEEQGFIYLTGDVGKDVPLYSSTFFKQADKDYSIPVKNAKRDVKETISGNVYVSYTFRLENPTYDRIIECVKSSLPDGYYDSLPEKYKW